MTPPIQSFPQRLPLLDEALLEPSFSRMICDLEAAKGAAANLRGRSGDPQHGVDVESMSRKEGVQWVAGIQCKHVRAFGLAEFKEELVKLQGYPRRLDEYRVVLACDASTAVRDFAKLQCGHAQTAGGPVRLVDVLDASDLSRELRAQPRIVGTYFGDEWRKAFCTDEDGTRNPAPVFLHFSELMSPRGYPTRWVFEVHGHSLGDHLGRTQLALRQAAQGMSRFGGAATCLASGKCDLASDRSPVYRYPNTTDGQFQRWREVALSANVIAFASHVVDTNERNLRLLRFEDLLAEMVVFLRICSDAAGILNVPFSAKLLRFCLADLEGLTLMASMDTVYSMVPLRGIQSDAAWTVIESPVRGSPFEALLENLEGTVGHFTTRDLGLFGNHQRLAVLNRESAKSEIQKFVP